MKPFLPILRNSRWSLLIAACVAVLLAAGCAQLTLKERELVFRVEPGTARWFNELPAGLREVTIPVVKGAVVNGAVASGSDKPQHLHAWWWPVDDSGTPTATRTSSRTASSRTASSGTTGSEAPTILYLHGARWNLTGHLFRIAQLRDFGFSVLAVDYRGFGKSDGDVPSEETVYEDAQAAWEHLVKLQPDPGRRYIYGHSLGGAVAVDLASRLSAASEKDGLPPAAQGLIIESSFTTLADIARSLTSSLLPAELILSQKFGKIAGVRMPVLVVHGREDRYVSPRFSEELHAAARSPKKLLLIDGGTHNNSMRTGSEAYRMALNEVFGIGARGERFGIVQR